MSHFMVLH